MLYNYYLLDIYTIKKVIFLLIWSCEILIMVTVGQKASKRNTLCSLKPEPEKHTLALKPELKFKKVG